MEYKEIKKKDEKDLLKMLIQLKDKLRDLRFKDANKQLKNIREIREIRKTAAKILTCINQKKKITAKK